MTIIGALPFLLQNGTTADATQVDADFDQIVTDVNNNAAHNGANNDITALSALTTAITHVQGGSNVYISDHVSAGTANAQTVDFIVPDGFTLAIGNRIVFVPSFTNTGPLTLDVNGTGATVCRRPSPGTQLAFTGREIIAGVLAEFVYDGAEFVLFNNATQYGGYGFLVSLPAATTTDLGTVATHNVLVTGSGVTITGFGSNADSTYPIYTVIFNGAVTLSPSAALLLPGSAAIATASGDTAIALYRGGGNWTILLYQKFSGAAISTARPTTQVFTSGSGTYVPTSANVRYIAVRLVGGAGGGGGGQNAVAATAGGDTTFSTFTAGGGAGGSLSAVGAGGGATGGYSNSTGSSGGAPTPPGTGYNAWGGVGGASQLGGGGAPSVGSATGSAGATNTGSGGGGGGATNGSLTGSGGAGGGSGGCVLGFLVAGSYSYVVGAGGAGAAGSSSGSSSGGAGGAGAAGKIEVIEYY